MEIENSSERLAAQWLRCYWPPVIVVGALIAGHVTASISRAAFMKTHGFFEIAMVAGYLAAVIYACRLWLSDEIVG